MQPRPQQTVIWQPQPGPQTALLECPVFEVFYGGARGGGKTEASIGDWLQHSSQYGEHAIGIFVRRKLTQLSEVIARTKQLFPKIGARYNEQQKTWTMPGGGRLKFVYLERDSDAEEYQGHSYTRLYVEEVTNFPNPGPIDKLRATLRSGAGVPVGMRLTGNPGGPGHNWVKARYINPCKTGWKIITEDTTFDDPVTGEKRTVALDRVFIPSKLGDNAKLINNDPTYILRLQQSGSEALVRAWLKGDWDVIDGAFFNEFDPEVHILPAEIAKYIPARALRFKAMDWGSAKPFCVGWYAVSDGTWKLPDGCPPIPASALVKYMEWYGAKGPNVGLKMDAAQVARGIIERERIEGRRVNYSVADPAIFQRDGGPSIAEMMGVAGVQWNRGDNKRKAGWQQVRWRLAINAHQPRPLLYFLDNCTDTIRTIPVLQHDEIDSEDLDTDGEDHAGDETRYACMSRPYVPKATPEPVSRMPKLPGEYTINELIEKLSTKRKQREAAY